ncbi:MAG: hypothetical protein QOK33_3872 [Mycobacterium sp.]|jgi:hypothetical protein|nr:hypothetical protein [Mycobacterium sp.]MDT5400641.1 hypothetical protein [Mycobacterium sp.]
MHLGNLEQCDLGWHGRTMEQAQSRADAADAIDQPGGWWLWGV